MADQDEEDYFSHDGLEDLPQSTLQDLELRALSSTQHHVAAPHYKQYKQGTRPFKLSVPSNGWQRSAPPSQSALPPHPPSSDYGLDDEDVIDLDEPSFLIQPASGPPQIKIAGQSNGRAQQTHSDLSQVERAYNAHSNAMVYEDGAQFYEHQDALQPAQPQHDMSALELRIAEVGISDIAHSMLEETHLTTNDSLRESVMLFTNWFRMLRLPLPKGRAK